VLRDGLLLGGGEEVLVDPRRALDERRIRRRAHAERDVQGGLLGTHRAQRGRAGRLRPDEGCLRGAPQGVLGEPRQGNDVGTQYRSGIYTSSGAQKAAALASKAAFGPVLEKAGFDAITTEILEAPPFYYAEDYHQQYLAKNPDGYCGLGGTGAVCPIGVAKTGA
jgi:hypothetical protein